LGHSVEINHEILSWCLIGFQCIGRTMISRHWISAVLTSIEDQHYVKPSVLAWW